jgi:type IV secretion system protein VirB9
MKTRTLILWSALIFATHSPVFAAAEGPLSDDRIKLLPYDENDVYTITTKYGYQTNIVFGGTETIDTISVGDRSLWQIIPSGNRLFIRPMQQGISTNMTILTNRHSYQFDLKSIAADEKDSAVIYVAKFTYPEEHGRGRPPIPMPSAPPPHTVMPPPPEEMAPSSPPAAPSALTPKPAAAQPMYPNYNYTYSGPDTVAPLQVFDNGETTFIKYRALPSPLPQVYIVDNAGNRAPVAVETKDSMLTVHAIAGTLAIVENDTTIMVYNEMLNPNK